MLLTDHQGAPRKVLDPSTGAPIWSWDARASYGMQAPSEDPDGDSVGFKLNLRMAGQCLDEETGLFHNNFRDYHPGLGRYIQSDPLGLEAGWNTYAYVGGDPVNGVDPWGLIIVYANEKGSKAARAIAYLEKHSSEAAKVIQDLKRSRNKYYIDDSTIESQKTEFQSFIPKEDESREDGWIYFNPNLFGVDMLPEACGGGGWSHPVLLLAHELKHAHRHKNGHRRESILPPDLQRYVPDHSEEMKAFRFEKDVAQEIGIPHRNSYYLSQGQEGKR